MSDIEEYIEVCVRAYKRQRLLSQLATARSRSKKQQNYNINTFIIRYCYLSDQENP